MPSPRRVTMREIARKLGIDQSTVSLALRDHPRISEAMRTKIRSTAREMGYEPDAMLSALAHYRRANAEIPVAAELAWINCWTPPEKLHRYKEFALYWNGAAEVARANGYHLEEFSVSEAMPLDRLNSIFRTRNIRGILLPPRQSGKGLDWSALEWERYASVRFGYSISELPIHAVVADQLGAGLLAFRKMHEKGYRRVGFVSTYAAEPGSRFLGGFLLERARTPEAEPVSPLLFADQDPEADRRELVAWLESQKPDAIFTTHAKLRQMLEEIGRRVPEDIGLAATSVLDANVDAGICQNSEELGRIAVELLISLINHNHRGIPKVWRMNSVQVHWVDGECLPDKR